MHVQRLLQCDLTFKKTHTKNPNQPNKQTNKIQTNKQTNKKEYKKIYRLHVRKLPTSGLHQWLNLHVPMVLDVSHGALIVSNFIPLK